MAPEVSCPSATSCASVTGLSCPSTATGSGRGRETAGPWRRPSEPRPGGLSWTSWPRRRLRRGWRVNSPNLEQVGLLKITYGSLTEFCADENVWQGRHELLANASPAERQTVAQTVLDFMRRELAIKVRYLDAVEQERTQQKSEQWLNDVWGLDRDAWLEAAHPQILQRPTNRRDRRPVLTDNNGIAYFP